MHLTKQQQISQPCSHARCSRTHMSLRRCTRSSLCSSCAQRTCAPGATRTMKQQTLGWFWFLRCMQATQQAAHAQRAQAARSNQPAQASCFRGQAPPTPQHSAPPPPACASIAAGCCCTTKRQQTTNQWTLNKRLACGGRSPRQLNTISSSSSANCCRTAGSGSARAWMSLRQREPPVAASVQKSAVSIRL